MREAAAIAAATRGAERGARMFATFADTWMNDHVRRNGLRSEDDILGVVERDLKPAFVGKTMHVAGRRGPRGDVADPSAAQAGKRRAGSDGFASIDTLPFLRSGCRASRRDRPEYREQVPSDPYSTPVFEQPSARAVPARCRPRPDRHLGRSCDGY